MKHLLVTLRIQNGEYSYHSTALHEVADNVNENEFAENEARTFYDEATVDEQPEAYYFNAGEVAVSIGSVKTVPLKDAIVLKKYL